MTFLFTDIEGSTRRWESDAVSMRQALHVHDEVWRETIAIHDGWLFKHTGDGVCAAFGSPRRLLTPRSPRSARWTCPFGWESRPARPSCVVRTFPEITTTIAHLREVLEEDRYESLARAGRAMTNADMSNYGFGQIELARDQLSHPTAPT